MFDCEALNSKIDRSLVYPRDIGKPFLYAGGTVHARHSGQAELRRNGFEYLRALSPG